MNVVMNKPHRTRASWILGACAVVLMVLPRAWGATDESFAQRVDLSPLDRVAVQADGRVRSFGSHARTYMNLVSGPRSINGQTDTFSYLDLMFRPERYAETDIIFIKNKPLCHEIVERLTSGGIDAGRAARMESTRLIAPALLRRPAVAQLLDERSTDLIRTAKFVDMIQTALFISQPEFLSGELRLVPPPDADRGKPWRAPDDLKGASAGVGPEASSSEALQRIAASWSGLRDAWRAGDAQTVNATLVDLCAALPTISPTLYPDGTRLGLESWYFRNGSMTWVWLVYLLSVIPLLIAVIYKWDAARRVGLAAFGVAFVLHTVSVAIRWYVSGRWPNANMFEAVTTSAWLGGVGALITEFLARKSPLRNLFALGSAIVSMASLMAARLLPTYLDSSISNKMPALNDVWLYIHTNVIIWSYAVIGLAAVTASGLLGYRWVRALRSRSVPALRLVLLAASVVAINVTAWIFLMAWLAPEKYDFATGSSRFACLAIMAASLGVVVFEGLEARRRRVSGTGTLDRSATGGADMLIRGGTGGAFLRAAPTAGQVLDAGTMVSMEVAFIMLWTGLVMGAIWADHSWGRPWGWDPKEVFALNTFIIFLLLVHVRLKVRDKAFWTAILAVVGFQVMMFNWIVINFVITGLHSYA